VGVSTGSGTGVLAVTQAQAISKLPIMRRGIIFDICEPMDFLLNLII
jgi:hypothetical protein